MMYNRCYHYLNNANCNITWNAETFKNVLFVIIMSCLLIILHVNYTSDSYLDHLFYNTCNTVYCSLIYGIIESILWLLFLCIIYFIIFKLFWKIRYKYKFDKFELLQYLDPYILSFPWLISPIISFHSITSCIIDICVLCSMYKNNENSDFDEYQQQQCNLSRTIISFIVWISLDIFLWKKSQLLFLFENGPNKALESIYTNYVCSVNKQLLPHVQFIPNLSISIISFLDLNTNWDLIEMKESIHNNLNQSNLNKPFLYLSILNAIISGFRLYMTPGVAVILYGFMIILGFMAFIIIVFMLVIGFNTGGDCNCYQSTCSKRMVDCGGTKFYACLGMIVVGLLWSAFVWFIMKLKLNKLNKIQRKCAAKHSEYKYERISLFYDDLDF